MPSGVYIRTEYHRNRLRVPRKGSGRPPKMRYAKRLRCSTCKKIKTRTSFYSNMTRSSRLASDCKKCNKIKNKLRKNYFSDYQKKHLDKQRINASIFYDSKS